MIKSLSVYKISYHDFKLLAHVKRYLRIGSKKKIVFMLLVTLLTMFCFVPLSMGQMVKNNESNTFTSPTIGATFVLIPAGAFMMGSPIYEPGRFESETLHQVTISRAFYMQTTEVTQRQWQLVMGTNPSKLTSCGDNCPVEQVSWNDVQDFIRKLNMMEWTDKYRLPTEAEWEYAARAGTTTAFSTGTCLSTDQANYQGHNNPLHGCPKGQYREKTVDVGSFAPNAWGLYNMHGNVWEWVQDWYGDYSSGGVTDPEGPSNGWDRVARGGAWDYYARSCRAAVRFFEDPGYRDDSLGFRLLWR